MPDRPPTLRPLWRWSFRRVWCVVALPWLAAAVGYGAYVRLNQAEFAAPLLDNARNTARATLQSRVDETEKLLSLFRGTRDLSSAPGEFPPIAAGLPALADTGVVAVAAWRSTVSAAWLYRPQASPRWIAVEERRAGAVTATLTELTEGTAAQERVPVRIPDEWRAHGEPLARAMGGLKEGKGLPSTVWTYTEQMPVSGLPGFVATSLHARTPDVLDGAQAEIVLSTQPSRPAVQSPQAAIAQIHTAATNVARWQADGTIAPVTADDSGEFTELFRQKHKNFEAFPVKLASGPAWGSGETFTLPGGEMLFVTGLVPRESLVRALYGPSFFCTFVFLVVSLLLLIGEAAVLRRFANALTRDLQEVRRLDVLRGPYYWPRTNIAELAALREAVQEAAAGLDNRDANLKDPVLLEAVVRAVPVEGEDTDAPTQNVPLAPPAAFIQAMDTVRRQLGDAKRELEALRIMQVSQGADPGAEFVLAERLLVGLRNHTAAMSIADTLAAGLAIRESRLYSVNAEFTKFSAENSTTTDALLPAELARAGHPLLFLAVERMKVLWIDNAAEDPRCARLLAERRLPEPFSLVALLVNDGKNVWLGLRPRGQAGWRAAEQVFAEAIARQQVAPAAPDEKALSATAAYPPGSAHALWAQPNLPADPDKPMYRELVDSAAAGMFTLSRAGRFTYLNTAAGQLFGVPVGTLLGQALIDRAATGEDGAVRSALQRVLEGAALEERDIHFKRPTGGPLLMRLYLAPLQDESGEPTGITGCVLDVTALREREMVLTRQEAVYRGIVEGAPQLLWSMDAIGCITFVNGVSTQIYGMTPEEIIGRPTTVLCDPATAEKDVERMALMMAGRACTGYRTTHRHKNGTPVPLVVVATRQLDESGNVTGAVGLAIALGSEDPA